MRSPERQHDDLAAPALSTATSGSRYRALAAMIFAVSMTLIDQTIVSIAAPQIQADLGLSAVGLQWTVNAYILAMAALFACGGRLSDTMGHRRMVVSGVVLFAVASAMCGLTPRVPEVTQAWIVTFRVLQGAGGAVMYPAALAIVVSAFPLRERGQALALFFAVAGVFTVLGTVLGGLLAEWTWRAIFWINVPVAVIAVALTLRSHVTTEHRPARLDYRGLVLIAAGIALSVFGFQQSAIWGWANPATGLSVATGVVLLVTFVAVERRTSSPLIRVDIFRTRAFLVDSTILALSMMVFVPLFLFASQYAQVCLGRSAADSWIILVYFFVGLSIAALAGGRMLDRAGVKETVVLGCVMAGAGLGLWAGEVTELDLDSQRWFIVLTGAGMGLVLGPVTTDAVNHASEMSYGEVVGITQTVRNFAGSLGLAILGTILLSINTSRLTASLMTAGMPAAQAERRARSIAHLGAGPTLGAPAPVPAFIRLDFASAMESVFFVMAAIMALAALVGMVGLPAGGDPRPRRRWWAPGSSRRSGR